MLERKNEKRLVVMIVGNVDKYIKICYTFIYR